MGLASPSARRPGWLWVAAAEAAVTDQQGGDGLGTRAASTNVQRK